MVVMGVMVMAGECSRADNTEHGISSSKETGDRQGARGRGRAKEFLTYSMLSLRSLWQISKLPRRNVTFTSLRNEREVFIQWDGTIRSKFHHIWLRDHCRCPQCFHPVTKQRLINTFDVGLSSPICDLEPVSTRSTSDGLEVLWPASSEPHVSIYPWPWLRRNSSCPSKDQEYSEKVLWGSRIAQDPPSVAYDEVMSDDEYGVYKWLSKIDKFGFCFVSGIPANPEATEKLANRIGFIRETHYGKFWDFTADLARGDTSYTNIALSAHTDNTYFTDPCGIQLFHLLEHIDGTGGATLLVDGFYVASILRDLYPDAYRLLSTVPIAAHAAGESEILYRATHPPLEHDSTGSLRTVRWNSDDRSVLRDVPYSDIPHLYEAMRTWNKLITSQDSEYWVQLSPGTAVAIDNHRVLHGRSAFTGKRRMCGAYIGGDEFRSRLSVLSEKFARPADLMATGTGKRGIWSHDF
ncbi:Trimethyllysine dioxygenase [Multifurca ochricompacta]|uniref:trimethyllysine dioxygenase n=1 Tax=Multifurca ochricompacta TaxID=376703 RepID=A0AAD4M1S9_9AGAM|nr:Trimethyllysine dioxygenase [Multifurca ochricompacta]